MFTAPAAIACADAGDIEAARGFLANTERSAALWEGTAWQAGMLEAHGRLARALGDTAEAGRQPHGPGSCSPTRASRWTRTGAARRSWSLRACSLRNL